MERLLLELLQFSGPCAQPHFGSTLLQSSPIQGRVPCSIEHRKLLQRLYCITCREYSVSWESTAFIRTQDDVHKFRFQTLISESHPTKPLQNCKSTVLLWCWCEVQGLEAGRPNVYNLHYSKCYRNNQFCAIMVSRKTPSRKVLQLCY